MSCRSYPISSWAKFSLQITNKCKAKGLRSPAGRRCELLSTLCYRTRLRVDRLWFIMRVERSLIFTVCDSHCVIIRRALVVLDSRLLFSPLHFRWMHGSWQRSAGNPVNALTNFQRNKRGGGAHGCDASQRRPDRLVFRRSCEQHKVVLTITTPLPFSQHSRHQRANEHLLARVRASGKGEDHRPPSAVSPRGAVLHC